MYFKDRVPGDYSYYVTFFSTLHRSKGGVLMMQWPSFYCLLQHLDNPENCATLLYIHFSSALNAIQLHQIIEKLQHP